ncbi:MAG: 4Fe-4S binding protein [Bacillota bacterium]|jgi:ferredoxin-type protein NapH
MNYKTRTRRLIQTVSFIVLTFGVYLFGVQISGIELPTFACSINREGLIKGSCYTLCHTKQWLADNLAKGQIGAIVIFLGVNLLLILILGRVLCGFICPFGFIQDLLDQLRQKLKIPSLRLNERQYQWLRLFKWEMLFLFLGGAYIGISFCSFCPIIAIIPPLAGREVNVYMAGVIAVAVVAGSFLKHRFWCNICPMGLLVGLFYKRSGVRLRKNCQACTECGACYEACPMGIKSIYTEREKADITTMDCLMCGECINCCPENDALSLVIAKHKFWVSSRTNFFGEQGLDPQKAVSQNIEKLI